MKSSQTDVRTDNGQLEEKSHLKKPKVFNKMNMSIICLIYAIKNKYDEVNWLRNVQAKIIVSKWIFFSSLYEIVDNLFVVFCLILRKAIKPIK